MRRLPRKTNPVLEAIIDRKWLASLLFVSALLGAWQLVDATGGLPAYVLGPIAIAEAVLDAITDGTLLPATVDSLARQSSGFAVGASLGVALGLFAGVSRWAEDILDPLISLTYPLPKIALFPVVVIWLGYTDVARVLVISVSCFFPAFINSYAGTKSIDASLLWVARNLGVSRLRAFWQVVLRAAMPSVINGVRISLALSFILTFATESLGASPGGLGTMIQDGFNDLRYPALWAGIAAFAFFGFIADQLWVRVSGLWTRGQQVEAVRGA